MIAPSNSSESPIGVSSGDRLGRYELIEVIGEGSMETVWLAQQDQPIKRRVALKIVKLGMDTAQVVARFEAEGQVLLAPGGSP